MLNWRGASLYELQLSGVYERLFFNHSKLLAFLFEPEVPHLRRLPEDLLGDLGMFSSGEKVLIQLALDLWDGSGNTLFWDIFYRLDSETLSELIECLKYLELIPSARAEEPAPIKNGMLP